MKKGLISFDTNKIQNRIITIQGKQIIIDRDLAFLYDVETKVLNQAVKRNINRFPNSFRFQLNDFEKNELVTNCDRFKNLKHSTSNPYAFTEQGVAMLSAVLRSETAVQISVHIMDAFVKMRKFLTSNAAIFTRVESVEKSLLEHKKKSDSKFNKIFEAIEKNEIKPKQGVFFEGEIFDAYMFVSNLFRSAETSILIIDNYVDDSVLTHLTKKKKTVKVLIYTKSITEQLKLDVKKFNSQYKNLTIKKFNKSHDRFIIIDDKDIYHFGASLKDLGKKWFAFSKFKKDALLILNKLEK
jgi:ORF6N domain-containing protein